MKAAIHENLLLDSIFENRLEKARKFDIDKYFFTHKIFMGQFFYLYNSTNFCVSAQFLLHTNDHYLRVVQSFRIVLYGVALLSGQSATTDRQIESGTDNQFYQSDGFYKLLCSCVFLSAVFSTHCQIRVENIVEFQAVAN